MTEFAIKECKAKGLAWLKVNEKGKIDFSHNPFSMSQGGLKALKGKHPLEILAYQYDLVCNGVELSSGAVRNHEQETIVKQKIYS